MKNLVKGCQIPYSISYWELTGFPVHYYTLYSSFSVVEVYLLIVTCRSHLHRFPYKGSFSFPEIGPFFPKTERIRGGEVFAHLGAYPAHIPARQSRIVIYQNSWTYISEVSVWQIFMESDTCRAQKTSDLPCRCSKVVWNIHNKSELSWKNQICCVCTKPHVKFYFWFRNLRQFYF